MITDSPTHSSDSKKDMPWWQMLSCKCSHHDNSTASDETRQKILMAAFTEIHRVGFQAASLQNILKSTGLSKGALYHHFPNKNELGYAVVDEIIHESVLEMWINPLTHQKDPIRALQHIIIDAGEQMTMEDIELGCPLSNLSQEMSSIDEGFRQRLEKTYSTWRKAIEESLEHGKANGYVAKKLNAKQFSAVFIATLEGCIAMAKSAQDISLLMDCGGGLINILSASRPEDWVSTLTNK